MPNSLFSRASAILFLSEEGREIEMKTNENAVGITQKHKECILAQKAVIEQMNEVISTQEKEINYLKQLNAVLEKENALLQEFNDEIMGTVRLIINEQ